MFATHGSEHVAESREAHIGVSSTNHHNSDDWWLKAVTEAVHGG